MCTQFDCFTITKVQIMTPAEPARPVDVDAEFRDTFIYLSIHLSILVQMYLLTGTKVQILTPEELQGL